jgi:type IV conjugative transfer system protein TraE
LGERKRSKILGEGASEMKTKTFFNNWTKLKEENNVLKVSVLVLTAGLIISVLTISKVSKDKTILILPPKVTKEFQVSGNNLSYEYIEQIGFYLSDRLLSISPANAQNSFDSIMPFLTKDPDAIKTIRESLMLQAKTIKDNDVYQAFYPMKVMINSSNNSFSVEGELKKMLGNNNVTSNRATVTFDFTVENGQLFIKSVGVK